MNRHPLASATGGRAGSLVVAGAVIVTAFEVVVIVDEGDEVAVGLVCAGVVAGSDVVVSPDAVHAATVMVVNNVIAAKRLFTL